MAAVDFQKKSEEIQEVIANRVKSFAEVYRSGPDLYFYKRALELNRRADSLHDFIHSDYNLEILYATLVAWDMNSRGAKMKYFDEFKRNVLSVEAPLKELWRQKLGQVKNIESLLREIEQIYDLLHVMKKPAKLVSNSKLLHFILPELLMPMDRRNTLMYFYGNTNESKNKYLDLIRWSYDFSKASGIEWMQFMDNAWNSTVPKILDNAIIIKNGISIKNATTNSLGRGERR